MSNGEYLYPHEIREAWQEAIDNLDLPPEEAGIIASVVQYAQPPLAWEALCKSTEVYSHDHDIMFNESIVKKFVTSEYISHSKPKRFATSHPVFFAFTHPAKFGKLSCPTTKHARRLLSSIFHDAASGEMVSRSQFYQHAIAARDVLISLIASGWHPRNTAQNDISDLLLAVHSDTMYGHIDDNFKRKLNLFEMMVRGDLEPGEIERKRIGGRGGSRGDNKGRRDVWHEERLAALAQQTQKTPSLRIPFTDQDSDWDSIGKPELKKTDIQPLKINDGNTDIENGSEAFYLQRKTPSSLTPADDRKVARYWLAGAPTSSVKSVADVGRLTPDLINQVMQAPLTPICHLYASLLVITGLPPMRMTRLAVSDGHTLEHIINHGDRRPYWLPDMQLLCYQLLDGPVKSDEDPAARWVILQLPESVASALSRADIEIKRRPFHGVRSALNRQLKKEFKNTSGIIPTANRLSASSWLYCRPHAIDDIAAATISGQFGLGMAAPAAYRNIPRKEHQQIVSRALQKLCWDVPETEGAPFNVGVTEQIGLSTAGSAMARSPHEFAAIFEKLTSAMQAPSAQLSRWWPGEPIPLAAITELHQLVSAHELLAWQLSTGARPIGPGSKNHLDHSLQWVYDKNSSIGRESRVIPLLATIRNSILSHQNWTNVINFRLNKNGVIVDNQRTGQRQTPSWMELSKRGNIIILRDMMWRDLATLPVIDAENWPSNICRHSIASWLRLHCPDAEVDHLLGHTRHGRMLASAQSETSLGQQHNLRKLLTKWLTLCGYRPLDWKRMPY